MITTDYNDIKIAYFCVPKCGKTSVKSILTQIKKQGGELHNYGDRMITPLMRWRGKDRFRFTVIREPVERLVSAYSNRITDRQDICRSSLSVALAKSLGLNPSPCPEEFILNLRKYAYINDRVFRHVVPQIRYTGADISFYDEIYNIKDMDKLTSRLSNMFDLEIETVQRNPSSKKFTVDDLSKEALEYAREFYKRDYDVFGKYF